MCQKNKVFIFNQLKNKNSVHFRTLCSKNERSIMYAAVLVLFVAGTGVYSQ